MGKPVVLRAAELLDTLALTRVTHEDMVECHQVADALREQDVSNNRLQHQHNQQSITIGFYQLKMQEHRELMRQFVFYWLRNGGCGMCGGIPHSTTCFVGKMDALLKGEPVSQELPSNAV